MVLLGIGLNCKNPEVLGILKLWSSIFRCFCNAHETPEISNFMTWVRRSWFYDSTWLFVNPSCRMAWREKFSLFSLPPSRSSSSTNITLSYTRKPSIIQLQKTKLRQYSHTQKNEIQSNLWPLFLHWAQESWPPNENWDLTCLFWMNIMCVFAFDIRFGLVQLRCHDCCCCCYFYGVVAHVEEELLLDETAMNSLVEKSRSSTPFHSISS